MRKLRWSICKLINRELVLFFYWIKIQNLKTCFWNLVQGGKKKQPNQQKTKKASNSYIIYSNPLQHHNPKYKTLLLTSPLYIIKQCCNNWLKRITFLYSKFNLSCRWPNIINQFKIINYLYSCIQMILFSFCHEITLLRPYLITFAHNFFQSTKCSPSRENTLSYPI